jgi:hypothetical protein
MKTVKNASRNRRVLFNQIPLVDNPFLTYNYKYAMTETQPSQAKNEAIWGLVQMGLSVEAAAKYAQVVVPKMTRDSRKSEGGFADVNTELWGTSPYLGQGDGIMLYTQQNNAIVRGFDSSLRGSRSRVQISDTCTIPYTFSMINVPLASASNTFIAGSDSRMERAYMNPEICGS